MSQLPFLHNYERSKVIETETQQVGNQLEGGQREAGRRAAGPRGAGPRAAGQRAAGHQAEIRKFPPLLCLSQSACLCHLKRCESHVPVFLDIAHSRLPLQKMKFTMCFCLDLYKLASNHSLSAHIPACYH